MQDVFPGTAVILPVLLCLRIVCSLNVMNDLLGIHAVLYEVDIELQEMGNQDFKPSKINAFMSLDTVFRPLPHSQIIYVSSVGGPALVISQDKE